MVDPLLHTAVRAMLAVLLLVTVAHKVLGFRTFVETVRNYRVTPAALVPVAAGIAVVAELATVAALAMAPAAMAAGAAAGLFGFYGAVMLFNIARGHRAIDCGCGWVKGAELSASLVVRNGVLVLLALMLLAPVTDRALVAMDIVNLTFFAPLMVGLYFLTDAVLQSPLVVARRRGMI